MAKCVNSITKWTVKIVNLDSDQLIDVDVRKGESLLNQKLESITRIILQIGANYTRIYQSALSEEEQKIDCNQAQDIIVDKLNLLLSETSAVLKLISEADITASTKHRYFYLYSLGIIENLQKLLIICGRLSDIDERIYAEDKSKPLICEESIVIHTLVTIWTGAIEIMFAIHQPAKLLFIEQQPEDQEYDYIDELEFCTAAYQFAKIFLADLIITSWMQFDRLLVNDSLIKGTPMLCRCQTETYFKMLKVTSRDYSDEKLLLELLNIMMDPDAKPSLATHSVRSYGVVPIAPSCKGCPKGDMSYFLIWHIYSCLKSPKSAPELKNYILKNCFNDILKGTFGFAMDQFKSAQLSPHQKERLELLFQMLDFCCQQDKEQAVKIVHLLVNHFNNNYSSFELHFHNSEVKIFESLTKLYNDILPIYQHDGQAADDNDEKLTKEERGLRDVWNKLLARISPPSSVPQAEKAKT